MCAGIDSFIVDESNQDTRFARNLLRRDVWPALLGAFPQAEVSLAASAQWAQEAAAAMSELAQIDLARVSVAGAPGDFALGSWLGLSPARRSNALRTWLRERLGAPAAASLVSRLMNELPATRSARWLVAAGELRLHRGVLRYATTQPDVPAGLPRESTLSVLRGGCYRLPGWAGRLQVTRVRDNGVPLARLARIDLRPREGAEKFQAGIGRPPRSLKKQFQSAGVPAWARVGPLIYSGGQLVFVPGLGLDARVIGVAGQALVSLSWLPAEAGS